MSGEEQLASWLLSDALRMERCGTINKLGRYISQCERWFVVAPVCSNACPQQAWVMCTPLLAVSRHSSTEMHQHQVCVKIQLALNSALNNAHALWPALESALPAQTLCTHQRSR